MYFSRTRSRLAFFHNNRKLHYEHYDMRIHDQRHLQCRMHIFLMIQGIFGYNDLKIVENKKFLIFGGSTVFSAKPREKLL